jgi:hypothetical protein
MQTIAAVAAAQQGAADSQQAAGDALSERCLLLPRLQPGPHLTHLLHVLKDLSSDDAAAPRFPGPNPVSLDTSHFPVLRSQPYYVCEKTDGVRYAMLCYTTSAGGAKVNVCALVDRALNAHLLSVRHLPRAAYQGTLLDGEVVFNRCSERWEYLIFDAMCVSGIPVLNSPLKERMNAVHAVMRVYAEANRRDPPAQRDDLDLRPKDFFALPQLDDFEQELHFIKIKHDVDGVILTPATAPVVYGRHRTLFKLKFDARHTVDFLVGADGVSLTVFDAGRHVPVGRLRRGAASPGVIAECVRAQPPAGQDEWDLVMVRTDKTTANDMFTYRKTMLNIREGLTLDSLKTCVL